MDCSKEKIDNFLRSVSFFKTCSEDCYGKLIENAFLTVHKKGKILFIQGDKSDRFYVVMSGWVKLYRETLDGVQPVVDILTTGHIFAEDTIFQNKEYEYSAEVVEMAEIISLPTSLLEKASEENASFALNFLKHMARKSSAQEKKLESMVIQNAPQRIGCFFLRLVPQDQGHKSVTLHLPYDKTLIAARLGMQPETFSRALKKLMDETGIKVKGATVEIDQLDNLVSFSCIACSSGFPCKNLTTCSG